MPMQNQKTALQTSESQRLMPEQQRLMLCTLEVEKLLHLGWKD